VRTSSLACLLLLSLLAAAPVAARESDADRKRAQVHVRLAFDFFHSGKYADALKELRRAHELVPLPDHVYNMARCHQEMGEEYEALVTFERYLEEADERKKLRRARKAVRTLAPKVAGALAVRCQPESAQVHVAGMEAQACPFRSDRVRAGLRKVLVSAPGHESVEREVEVAAGGEVAELEVQLHPLPARLEVSSEPAGAAVALDGEPAGSTPLAGLTLAPGRHRVVVTRPGFREHVVELELSPGEGTKLTAELERQAGRLELSSAPEGARVIVDGRPVGATPVEGLELPAGEHLLQVEAMLHAGWRRHVEVRDRETVTLFADLPSHYAALGLAGAAALALAGGGLAYLATTDGFKERDQLLDEYAAGDQPAAVAALRGRIRDLHR